MDSPEDEDPKVTRHMELVVFGQTQYAVCRTYCILFHSNVQYETVKWMYSAVCKAMLSQFPVLEVNNSMARW